MPALPHNFPTLRHENAGDQRTSLLTIGAGMSRDTVPMHGQLFADKRLTAENSLHCTTTPAADDLYKWADEIVTQRRAQGDRNPKLSLAKSIGLIDDLCWRGSVSTVRNTPRHRVIARFARESLWEQIWSLNWDCVQESALENVGITQGIEPALDSPPPYAKNLAPPR